MVFHRDADSSEGGTEVCSGARRQRLSVSARAGPDEAHALVLSEGGVRMRSWPLHAVRFNAEHPGAVLTIEAGGEVLTFTCADEASRRELCRTISAALTADSGRPLADAALGALLEDAAPEDADAEQWVKHLADRLAKLDALNVGGMLAAATEGGGAKLAERLEAGVTAGSGLSARLSRYDGLVRAAAGATAARSGAARADRNARALLTELEQIYAWLDATPLADLEALPQISLGTSEGRSLALSACASVRAALRAERAAPPARRRLAAVRERLRRIAKARDHLCVAVSRHLNNCLIHLGNEAVLEAAPRRHHRELLPYAPFMRCLRQMDEKAYAALVKVYVSAWSRVYERSVRAACESARAALAAAPPAAADALLDQVLAMVEDTCNAEQDFCTLFLHLDVDLKGDGSDGERSEKSDGGERAEPKRPGAETKRLMGELFPALETELVALVGHVERHDPYGAMRALACVGRRVLGGGEACAPAPGTPGGTAGTPGGNGGTPGGNGGTPGGNGGTPGGNGGTPGGNGATPGGNGSVSVAVASCVGVAASGDGRWSRAALASVAVAAKRGADRIVAEKIAALPDAVKQAGRKPKCGILSFVHEFESLSRECEAVFGGGGRRADLERWYAALVGAMLRAVHHAEHPRTPRHVIHTENYHRLHGVVSALRSPALEAARRECRARYADALRHYVTQYFGRPLEKLTQFFEGVAEVVASGVREDEVCYRAAFSKHELRRVLAMYPAQEVRKSLHRLYRTVEKHVSEEGGLLQVVWRAMQEEFLAQHTALQARIAACYPGAGLSLPLTTEDILNAFSDIAREH